jgi:putative SOS response-associated peptidase YedK
MCGRFVSSSTPEEIASTFGATEVAAALDPNYNVTPSNDVYVVYQNGSARTVDAFWWGLIPSWAKDPSIGNRLINARGETVAEKNAFRSSLQRKRCIVPADGFYEWKKIEGQKKKQPYFISRPDGEPFAFGGLWAEWKGEFKGHDTVIRSTTIITTTPNEPMSELHHRMPVILPPTAWAEWLDPQVGAEDVGRLLVPAPAQIITFHPVSTEVNNGRSQGEHLIDEAPPLDETVPD